MSNTHLVSSNNASGDPLNNSKNSNEEDKELPAAEKSLLQKIVRTGLITSKHDIEVQRRDPRSPLYSIKSFELLKL